MRAHRRTCTPFGCNAVPKGSRYARGVRVRADAPQQGSGAPQLSQEEMEQRMQDPEVQEKMKEMQAAMQQPEVQEQVQQMQAAMQNQDLQNKLQGLKDDPDFKDMFDDIQKNGMSALMKYYNDPNFLAKLGSKMGDVKVPEAAAQAAPEQPPAPEDLIDAARMGDEEAVEDFVAVGKDVNMRDAEQRTPLHFAAAMNQVSIAKLLLEAGADLAAVDSKQNNPLHIAAGYGRLDMVDILIEKGCDVKAQNASGKTAKDLAGLNEQNPVLQSKEIMDKLSA